MSRIYEIVIFTAGRQDYADKMVNMLDPEGKYICERLYRQYCVPFRGICVKDFRVISNRNPENMMMVDNYLYSFSLNLETAIPIKPYIQGQEDCELKYLADQLEKIKPYESCAEFVQNNFRSGEFFEFVKTYNPPRDPHMMN